MKTWGEIKKATLYKLNLTEDEYGDDYGSMIYLANECLNSIANDVKPNNSKATFTILGKGLNVVEPTILADQVVYKNTSGVLTSVNISGNYTFVDSNGNKFKVEDGKLVPTETITNRIDGDYFTVYSVVLRYKEGVLYKFVTPNTTTVYIDEDDVHYLFDGTSLVEQTNVYAYNEVVKMPDDFISFADMINYKDGEKDPVIIYYSENELVLPETGNYVIFYNGLYPNIEDSQETVDSDILDIPTSVLNLLPTYIASQILAEDDLQRATILRNEYELMLSRLDNNVMYESNHFKSSRGWY